ncbi:hypothetical protein Micbo1qcDRAFT_155165 [Microdochium bolleyi]|uniref:C2H2-type domain-containing protein n=1 Tax=Microdochium bolleyi TaxID=196109 RepID=A0A136JHL5_9PEZI|nr:hypothetical protein Micbo1qcDRAFT_155165 [Microdochium bolleyi]
MDDKGPFHYANAQPFQPVAGAISVVQPSSTRPVHMSTSGGFLLKQESGRPANTQIRPPSIPEWARPQDAVYGHPQSTLPGPGSRTAISPAKQESLQTAERRADRSPSASQFTVQLKSSPLRQPSLYHKVDDGPVATSASALPRQGRKRPQPGAMGVRNMFAVALGAERGVTNGGDSAGSTGDTFTPSTPGSINKRGRPKGWKPGMSYSAIRGNPPPNKTPGEKGSGPGLPRGRKPGATIGTTIRREYLRSKAEFAPFVCEWLEQNGQPCPAELHNLDTLRKHVFLVHISDNEGSPEDTHNDHHGKGEAEHEDRKHTPQICRWAKCGRQDPPRLYDSEDALDDHMEAHLNSISWHVGDGHQNRGIASVKQEMATATAYLFGKDGSQITPSIKDQTIESDQQRKDRKRRLRYLEMQRDENAPDEEEFLQQTLGAAATAEEQ